MAVDGFRAVGVGEGLVEAALGGDCAGVEVLEGGQGLEGGGSEQGCGVGGAPAVGVFVAVPGFFLTGFWELVIGAAGSFGEDGAVRLAA